MGKLSSHIQHGFIRSVENVLLTKIVNTLDGASVVCDVWQIECHIVTMADSKAMCADDTKEPTGSAAEVMPPDASIVMLD